MVSIIQGLNKAFADQVESLGSNTIFVSKFEPSFGRPPGPDEIHRKDLTMDDAEALRREAPSVAGVSPIHRMIAVTARYQDKANGHADSARRHALLRICAHAVCRSRSFHQRFRHGQSRQRLHHRR